MEKINTTLGEIITIYYCVNYMNGIVYHILLPPQGLKMIEEKYSLNTDLEGSGGTVELHIKANNLGTYLVNIVDSQKLEKKNPKSRYIEITVKNAI